GDDRLFGDAGADVIWGGSDTWNDHTTATRDDFTHLMAPPTDSNASLDAPGFQTPNIVPGKTGGASVDGVAADGNNILSGGADGDWVFAGGGNDTAQGDGGSDYVDGGDGQDFVSGGAGNDVARGGLGDDVIRGDAGIDQVYGDRDDD